MPQKKDNEQTSPIVKRLQADVKGGQGTFFLAAIVSLIYVVRTLLAQNFGFFFSLFVPEVLLKSAAFTADYPPAFEAQYSAFFADHLHGAVPNAAIAPDRGASNSGSLCPLNQAPLPLQALNSSSR